MFESLIVQFVVLWAVIDPIGSIPVYLSKTASLSALDRRRVASKAILVSTGILLFFWLPASYSWKQCRSRSAPSKPPEDWCCCCLL